jgi:predicted enzyme related to lactoylglutathione lyase
MLTVDPIIAVSDVEASSLWYRSIFNFKSMHDGKVFDVLVSDNGNVVLCLHKWGEHQHPTMMNPQITPGNGLILYFRTGDLYAIRQNAEEIGAKIIEDIHLNTNSTKQEFSILDPDGYYLTITEYHQYEG